MNAKAAIAPSRNLSIDFLRIFSCLCILILHESGYLLLTSNTWYAYQAIVRPCLWTFTFISGYFVLNKQISSIKSFYLNKLFSIILPLFIYSIIYQVCQNLAGIHSFSTLAASISVKDILTNNVSSHLWFVYSLTGLYLITPLLQKLLKLLPPLKWVFVLSFIFVLQLINDITGVFDNKYGIPILFSGTMFFYFILGYAVNKINVLKYRKLFIGLGLLNIIVIFYLGRFELVPKNLYTSSLNMAIGVLFYYVIFSGINFRLNDQIKKIVIYISNKTYGIYLIHILVLTMLHNRDFIKYTPENHLFLPILVSLLIFLISLACTVIIDFFITNPLIKICKKIQLKSLGRSFMVLMACCISMS